MKKFFIVATVGIALYLTYDVVKNNKSASAQKYTQELATSVAASGSQTAAFSPTYLAGTNNTVVDFNETRDGELSAFLKKLQPTNDVVVVDFSGDPSCPYSLAFLPIFKQQANTCAISSSNCSHVKFVRVGFPNWEGGVSNQSFTNIQTSVEYNITGVPTVFMFKNGNFSYGQQIYNGTPGTADNLKAYLNCALNDQPTSCIAAFNAAAAAAYAKTVADTIATEAAQIAQATATQAQTFSPTYLAGTNNTVIDFDETRDGELIAFLKILQPTNDVVVVDFTGDPWCGPSSTFLPIFKQQASTCASNSSANCSQVKFVRVFLPQAWQQGQINHYYTNLKASTDYPIPGTPTVFMFKNGNFSYAQQKYDGNPGPSADGLKNILNCVIRDQPTSCSQAAAAASAVATFAAQTLPLKGASQTPFPVSLDQRRHILAAKKENRKF